MKIEGKITMAELVSGVKVSTNEPWQKMKYVLVYNGHYANGTSCLRSISFEVFGENRIKQLGIIKDQTGTLDVETYTRTNTSQRGTQYLTNELDVLSWTPAGQTGTPAPTPAPAVNSDDRPF